MLRIFFCIVCIIIILIMWIKYFLEKKRKTKIVKTELEIKKDNVLYNLKTAQQFYKETKTIMLKDKNNEMPIEFYRLRLKSIEYDILSWEFLYNDICQEEQYIKNAKKTFDNLTRL